ncbi:MAG: transcription elongation factor GreAB [Myxococcales bacterium]|nr:transcription elongation factor GreAB [Myxococcales bacterium]
MVDPAELKRSLVAQLVSELKGELSTMQRAAQQAREAATHEEAKPENDKDTRALEASYLAGAQAARVRELEVAIKTVTTLPLLDFAGGKTIQASALVTLEDEDGEGTIFFFAPVGGGARLTAGGREILVLTPQSPRGQALLGARAGDVIEVKGRELTIVSVE